MGMIGHPETVIDAPAPLDVPPEDAPNDEPAQDVPEIETETEREPVPA